MEEIPQPTAGSSLISGSSDAAERCNAQVVAEQIALINQFLLGKEIIIYVAGTNNFGIQAAAFDVIRALTNHFNIPEITVVYASTTLEPLGANETWDGDKLKAGSETFKIVPMWPKLRIFLPALTPDEPRGGAEETELQFSATTKLIFWEVDNYLGITKNKPRLFISGAMDGVDEVVKQHFISTARTGEISLLDAFDLEECLILQLFHRSVSESRARSTFNKYFQAENQGDHYVVIDERDLDVELEDQAFVDLSYQIPAATVPSRENLQQILPQLPTLIEQVQGGRVHLLPIYFSQNRTLEPFHVILFNLILGLVEAKRLDIDQFRKPVVILLLNHVRDQDLFQALKYIVEGIPDEIIYNEQNNTYQLKSKIESKDDSLPDLLYLRKFIGSDPVRAILDKVEVIDGSEAGYGTTLEQQLNNEGSITVLALRNIYGQVIEQNTFNYLFSQASLPCAFEGTGTTSFVLSRGLPFCQLLSTDFNEFVKLERPLPQNIQLSQSAFDEVARFLDAIHENPLILRPRNPGDEKKFIPRVQGFLTYMMSTTTPATSIPLFRIEKTREDSTGTAWRIIDIEDGSQFDIRLFPQRLIVQFIIRVSNFAQYTILSAHYPFYRTNREAVSFLHTVSMDIMRNWDACDRWLQAAPTLSPAYQIGQYFVASQNFEQRRNLKFSFLQEYLIKVKNFYQEAKHDKVFQALLWLAQKNRGQ